MPPGETAGRGCSMMPTGDDDGLPGPAKGWWHEESWFCRHRQTRDWLAGPVLRFRLGCDPGVQLGDRLPLGPPTPLSRARLFRISTHDPRPVTVGAPVLGP